MSNLSYRLRTCVKRFYHDLDGNGAIQRFLQAPSVERYSDFLIQTFHYVRWTAPLLEQSGRRLGSEHPALAELLLHKAQEEQGHEDWVLSDLAALGVPPRAVWRRRLLPSVAAYVAWNRFTASQGCPAGILGTAYVLEALAKASAGQLAERLARAVPAAALLFLRGHADEDPGHVAELERVLQGVHRSEAEAICVSAEITRQTYFALLAEISSRQ